MASFKELKQQQAALRAAVAGGGQIVMPEAAAERMKSEHIAKVQAHLDLADVERDAANDLFGALVVAETRRTGVPGVVDLAAIRATAQELTRERYAEKWRLRAAVFAELGVTELDTASAHWVWAAKRHGVDLVPVKADPPAVIIPEPPRLVEG